MAALLIRDASPFDVVVTTNMYGDILSDEASEIAGSLGLAASLNAGAEHAVAQAQHGSAPDIAGKNVANPSSLIGSAAMLLAWLGERRGDKKLKRAAQAIEAALDRVIAKKEWRTPDMGGPLGTDAFGQRVAQARGRISPRALELPLEPDWQGAVKANLEVTLRHAALTAPRPPALRPAAALAPAGRSSTACWADRRRWQTSWEIRAGGTS